MPPLKALLIADNRPGHVALAEGILAAIARRRDLNIVRLDVQRPRYVPARLLSALTNRHTDPATILRRVYGVAPASLPKAGLIVSAGGDTLAANIACARLLGGAPNLFYGSLRRFKPEDFTLVLNSYARYADHPKYLVTLKPNKLDPDDVGVVPFDLSKPLQTAGLLLGGDTPTMNFDAAAWQRIADFVSATCAGHGTRWIISNSRRTPAAASDLFAALATGSHGPGGASSPVERFIDVRQGGSGTLRALFAASQAIAVTADSSSMLSEAIWARRPVIALSPDPSGLPADEQDYRNFLIAKGWTGTIALQDLSPQGWHEALARQTPLAGNPLDLLADDLNRRLPHLFT